MMIPTWLIVAGIVAAMAVVAVGIIVAAVFADRHRKRNEE